MISSWSIVLQLALAAPPGAVRQSQSDVVVSSAENAPPPSVEVPPDAQLDAAVEEAPGPAPGAPTISLEAAVAAALEHNYSILSSVDSVSSSHQRESSAFAEFLPKATPRFERTDDVNLYGASASQKLPWLGGTISGEAVFRDADALLGTDRTGDFRLTLTQPLLRGMGPTATHFNLTNARRNREGEERNLTLMRQSVVVQTTSAFFGVIAQRHLVAVARQSLHRSESLVRASQARLEVGLVSKLDVFRAELQAAQTQEALVRAEAALETALERFRALLAMPPSDALEPAPVALPETTDAPPEPLEVLVPRALENRLDLREIRDQVRDARRGLSVATQNLLPQLDLGLYVTRSGHAPSYTDVWAAGEVRSGLNLTASYPLERSVDKANRAFAQLTLARQLRAVRQKEEEVEGEVRAAARELERIRKSVELQRKGVLATEQQRRLALLRYQRGLASNFDVVDAEGSFLVARSALVSLLVSHEVAKAELLRVTGVLDAPAEATP